MHPLGNFEKGVSLHWLKFPWIQSNRNIIQGEVPFLKSNFHGISAQYFITWFKTSLQDSVNNLFALSGFSVKLIRTSKSFINIGTHLNLWLDRNGGFHPRTTKDFIYMLIKYTWADYLYYNIFLLTLALYFWHNISSASFLLQMLCRCIFLHDTLLESPYRMNEKKSEEYSSMLSLVYISGIVFKWKPNL